MDVPPGGIIIWAGFIPAIPAGFVICDGNNGTPDLRDRFIVGAGGNYNVNDAFGADTHVHAFTGDPHTHLMPGGSDIAYGAGYNQESDTQQITGTTDLASSMPPYYALAFIMKT